MELAIYFLRARFPRMDGPVIAALAKWPNVPACYGWVALDARGQWRLGSPEVGAREIVRHSGLAAFLGRNYACTESGEWFCQNGPQRAFVDLEAAPFALRLHEQQNQLIATTHSGLNVEQIRAAHLGDDLQIYLLTEHGLAVVDDRDLPRLLSSFQRADQRTPCSDAAIAAMLDGDPAAPDLCVHWRGDNITLSHTTCAELARRYAFVKHPRASV